ncbi:MAG: hypothetical protein AAF656_00900 [Planctomycetota bacterium]
MAKDPLKIVGQPKPTEEERAKVMAFAEATGRPAKFCRAALIEAKWDEAEARRLIDDETFVRMNTDFDFGAMSKLAENPAAFVEYMTRQQMTHAGASEADIAKATAKAQADAAEFEREEAEFEKHEAERLAEVQGKTIDDPTFGKLTFDDYTWEGTVDLPPFGTGLGIAVEIDEEDPAPPTDRQRAAFEAFRADAANLRAKVEQAHFDEFRARRPDLVQEAESTRELLPDLHTPVPDPQTPAEIWEQVDDETSIVVEADLDDDPITITLGYAVDWDVEHGNYIRFRDGQVVETGCL